MEGNPITKIDGTGSFVMSGSSADDVSVSIDNSSRREGDRITNIGRAGTVHAGSVSNTSNTNNTITNVTNYITYGTGGGEGTSIKPLDHIIHKLFLKAAKVGNAAGAAKALDDGAYVDFADAAHRTALYWAVQKDSVDIASVLIQHGADLDDPNAVPYVTLALDQGKVNVALLLLENVDKAGQIKTWLLDGKEEAVSLLASQSKKLAEYIYDFGRVMRSDEAQLKRACGRIAAFCGIQDATLSRVRSILGKCYGSNGPNENSWTKAHIATITGNLNGISAKELESLDSLGNTPLHWAVLADTSKAIQTIVKCGGNSETGNTAGDAPFHLAARFGKMKALKTLFQLRANWEGRTRSGHTPLHIAILRSQVAVIQLLLEKGALKGAKFGQEKLSYVEFAAAHGKGDALEALLKGGVPSSDRTMDLAAATENLPILRSLVSSGVCTQQHLHQALHRAIEFRALSLSANHTGTSGKLVSVATLLRAGAPLSIKNCPKGSLLLAAIDTGNLKIFSLVLDKGHRFKVEKMPPLVEVRMPPHIEGRRPLHSTANSWGSADLNDALEVIIDRRSTDLLKGLLAKGLDLGPNHFERAMNVGWPTGAWELIQAGLEVYLLDLQKIERRRAFLDIAACHGHLPLARMLSVDPLWQPFPDAEPFEVKFPSYCFGNLLFHAIHRNNLTMVSVLTECGFTHAEGAVSDLSLKEENFAPKKRMNLKLWVLGSPIDTERHVRIMGIDLAAARGNVDIVNALASKGVKVDLNALRLAAGKGQTETLRAMLALREWGTHEIHATLYGAIKQGKLPACRLLLEHPAFSKEWAGELLTLARKEKRTQCVSMLEEAGVESDEL